MSTGHHQWLSNEVVAMETGLYETLIKKRPCTVPQCVSVSVFVPLLQPYWAPLTASTGMFRFYEVCPFLKGLNTALWYTPSLLLSLFWIWLSAGFHMPNYSPWLTVASWLPWFDLVSRPQTAAYACCPDGEVLGGKSAGELLHNASWSLLIQ